MDSKTDNVREYPPLPNKGILIWWLPLFKLFLDIIHCLSDRIGRIEWRKRGIMDCLNIGSILGEVISLCLICIFSWVNVMNVMFIHHTLYIIITYGQNFMTSPGTVWPWWYVWHNFVLALFLESAAAASFMFKVDCKDRGGKSYAAHTNVGRGYRRTRNLSVWLIW